MIFITLSCHFNQHSSQIILTFFSSSSYIFNHIADKSDAPKKPSAPKDTREARPARPATAPSGGDVDVEGGKDNNRGGRKDVRDGKKTGRGGRGESRGGRGGDDAVAAGAGQTRARREKDRRTTAGPGGKQSKDGAGAAGWGSEKGEAQQAEKDPSSAEVPIDADEADPESTPEEVVEVEPEPTTFTLDQFAAKQEEEKARLLALVGGNKAVRKVTQDFSGLKTSDNTLSDLLVLGSNKAASSGSAKAQRSEEKKKVVELSFKFNPDPQAFDERDRGDRGGRGGGRGRGEGRGDGRGGRGRGDRPQSARQGDRPRGNTGSINVNDQMAFPSL